MIRRFRGGDESSVDALLRSAWPEDPTLGGISAIHGADLDSDDRWRRTRVFVDSQRIVGAATLLATARHPSRIFAVVVVDRERRQRGIGTALLTELRRLSDGRPLLGRARQDDVAALAFARAHGFDVLMRNRVGVVDPSDTRVGSWIANTCGLAIDWSLSPEEFALAHEDAYRAEHASWAPAAERPLEESLRLFCGESWLPQTGAAVRSQGRVVAVAGLHGPPLAPSESELFLIAGSPTRDASALRAVVAAELRVARSLGATVSIEVDEANAELTQILAELPAVLEPILLLLSTDRLSRLGGRYETWPIRRPLAPAWSQLTW